MSKQKFNWGHGLALALIGWVGLMVYMGFKCFTVDAEFVREDYYQAELEHEDKMAATALGNDLSAPRVSFAHGSLIMEGDSAALDLLLSGSASLYVPTNARLDRAWQWSELPGRRVAGTRYEVVFEAPSGLAYLTFNWFSKRARGKAEKRIPVHFPVQRIVNDL